MYRLKSKGLMKAMDVLFIALAAVYAALLVRKILLMIGALPTMNVYDAVDGVWYCIQVGFCIALLLIAATHSLRGNIDGIEFPVVLLIVLEVVWIVCTLLFTSPVNFLNLSLNLVGLVIAGVWWWATRPDIILTPGAAPMSEFIRVGSKRN